MKRTALRTRKPLPTLFEDLTGGGRHHRNDHDTSLEAAKTDRTTLRERVLEAYRLAGPRGLTDDDCATRAAIAYRHSAATRRKELQERGFPIVDSGRRRPTPSGRSSIVWTFVVGDER